MIEAEKKRRPHRRTGRPVGRPRLSRPAETPRSTTALGAGEARALYDAVRVRAETEMRIALNLADAWEREERAQVVASERNGRLSTSEASGRLSAVGRRASKMRRAANRKYRETMAPVKEALTRAMVRVVDVPTGPLGRKTPSELAGAIVRARPRMIGETK